MITKEELDAMIEEKLKSLGVGSPEFIQGCKELDDMIEKAKAPSSKKEPENNFGTRGSGVAFEEETPKKVEDVQLLDDLGEIRNLLEKASNSLDNFQCRYKLMLTLDDDAVTQSWFFEQRKDMELGVSIISDYIISAQEKLFTIEQKNM